MAYGLPPPTPHHHANWDTLHSQQELEFVAVCGRSGIATVLALTENLKLADTNVACANFASHCVANTVNKRA